MQTSGMRNFFVRIVPALSTGSILLILTLFAPESAQLSLFFLSMGAFCYGIEGLLALRTKPDQRIMMLLGWCAPICWVLAIIVGVLKLLRVF